ncbi:HAD family hydrolase [Aquibacillus salsiterrae]|uniref:HAD family hydrolase n=1 Tax=Aquibacillus salsiterrae TaxID=2950439 RepID=A0A9X3WF72_9BACI|nr:HAD family hydrolase [Aquibacillus salsiterrae]MDC3415936.1 HAD family hydrolase [Aquibacillus salsiterrae]
METIIFDVDDTLYDQTLPFKKAFTQVIQEPFSDEKIDKVYIASRKYSDALFDEWEAGEVSTQQLHTYRITAACEEFGIGLSEQTAIAFQAAYYREQQRIQLFDAVEQLLDLLHQENKQLAVLTNGGEHHQRMKMDQLAIERWIPKEHIFISGALGHAKPKQEAFHFIEDKLKLDKAQTVYIGDSFDNDIVGAKQVGWKAIWLNHRHRKLPKSNVRSDATVFSAKELLDLFSTSIHWV